MSPTATTDPVRRRPAGPMLKIFLGVIIFTFFLLGHVGSTLLLQYVGIVIGFAGYTLSCRGSLADSFYFYLMSRYMAPRWWLVAWMMLSLLWSVNQGMALMRIVSTLLIYLVSVTVFDAVRNHGLTRFVLQMVFYAASVCAVVTVISVMNLPVNYRPVSIFGNPNVIALISLLGLVVYLFDEEPRRGWLPVLVRHGLGLALFASTFSSSSRKGLLGVFVLALVAMFRRTSRRRLATLALAGLPVAVVALSLSSTLYHRSVLTALHLQTITEIGSSSASDESLSERTLFMELGAQKIAESPLIGHGLESFRTFVGYDTYSHNNYVEIAVSLGIVGLLLYYLFYVQLLVVSINRLRATPEGSAAIAFLVLALILDVGFVSYLFKPWILFSVLVAGLLSRRSRSPWVESADPTTTGDDS